MRPRLCPCGLADWGESSTMEMKQSNPDAGFMSLHSGNLEVSNTQHYLMIAAGFWGLLLLNHLWPRLHDVDL